jgi:hypothetical protein
MKKALFAAVVTAALVAGVGRSARATEVGYNRSFGLGLMLGDPTGLTAKLWVGRTNALDFGVGFWGYGVNDRCFQDANGNTVCTSPGVHNGSFHMDYLWQSNIVRSSAQLDWHIGAGGRAVFWGGGCVNSCVNIIARAPVVGLDLMFTNPGWLELFFEIAPAFYIVPPIYFDVEGGIGVRFYF